MRLKNIQAKNLKGKPINFDLAPITVFHGPNTVGKTAVKNAITLCVNGYVPELGKEASSTLQLCTGEAMMVQGQLDSGTISNQIWQHKSPKYSGAPIVTNPAILADINVFFAMTGPQRSALVFSLAPDAEALGLSTETIRAALAGLQVSSERASQFRSELIAEMESWAHDEKPQEWVPKFRDDVTTQLSAEEKTLKGLIGAANAKTATQSGALFVETIPADIEQQLKAAREAHAELDKQDDAITRDIQRISETLGKIERAKSAPAVAIPPGDPDALAKQIAKLEKEREAIVLDPKAGKALMDATNKHNQAKFARESAERAHTQAFNAVTMFKEDACCAACNRPFDKVDRAAAKKKLVAAEKSAVENVLKCQSAEEKAEASKTEAGAAAQAEANRDQKRMLLTCDISRLNSQRTAILQARAKATIATPNYGDEAALAAEIKEKQLALINSTEKLHAAEAKVQQLDALNVKAIAARQDRKRAQEAEESRWVCEARVQVLKLAKKALADAYETFNSKIWDSLATKARAFTDGILGGKLEFHDGEIGFWRGEQFVTPKTFSGMERAVTFAGLQIALCQDAPLKVLMFDEGASAIDDTHMVKFLVQLHGLIKAGVFDQAFFFDHQPRYEAFQSKLKLGSAMAVIEIK